MDRSDRESFKDRQDDDKEEVKLGYNCTKQIILFLLSSGYKRWISITRVDVKAGRTFPRVIAPRG